MHEQKPVRDAIACAARGGRRGFLEIPPI